MAFKVLLVEDDNNLREIYEARLQAEGYDIVTARDGEEALGVAKTEVPDLVISDVMMPRVSGFEMLDILRNTDALKDVKVIMLTALGQADDKTRANSLGADRYLVKSQVTLEDIVKTAHELLGDTSPEVTAAPTPSAAPAAPSAPAPNTIAAPAIPIAPAPVMPAPAPSPVAAPTVAPAPPVATPPTMFSPTAGTIQPPVVPAPAPVAPAPVAPTPSMPPLPGAAPSVAPVAAPMPTPASAAPTAPSTSEEQATVASQINNFVQTAPDTTPAAEPSGSAAQDDAVLADAMHDLAESTKPEAEDGNTTPATPQPSATPITPMSPVSPAPAASQMPPIAPMPATPPLNIAPRPMTQPNAPASPAESDNKHATATGGSVPIANKKIIQPLSGPEVKPDIHELAAREEANNMAGAPSSDVTSPAAPSFSPNTSTPPMPPAGPVVGGPGVTPPTPQTPPANPGGFDPNSISL